MTTPRFGRMITAMVTPFGDDLSLDLPRAEELADKLLSEGSEGLVVCGTTGESPTVFYPQKMELFRTVIDAVGGRAPVIANAGDNCTDDSVDFAKKSSPSASTRSWRSCPTTTSRRRRASTGTSARSPTQSMYR
jgi:4-hydroxy-tetrahydrodipicolinate synthase